MEQFAKIGKNRALQGAECLRSEKRTHAQFSRIFLLDYHSGGGGEAFHECAATVVTTVNYKYTGSITGGGGGSGGI